MIRKKYLSLGIGLMLVLQSFSQIQQVEPANWWVGMKNPKLQLLVHGKNIGETTPTIHYSGVHIQKVTRGDSPNYLFIDLVIAPHTRPGNFPIEFSKEKKVIEKYNYTLLQRQKGADQIKGFGPDDVIYLITPDRFANGNYDNDVAPGMLEKNIDRKGGYKRHGGDIRGIIDHLDYIATMGFTAIWPTPLLENNMPEASYHGYAITNHYQVDPRFGNLEDYKELAVKARQKGIKLIFDGVLNHIGSNYWWMNDLPFKNWLHFPDSIRLSNHRRTVHEDPYASKTDRQQMTDGWFVPSMPDLNQQNPFLANYLIQNNIWWIETLSLGGLRQDTYPYSDKHFLQTWSCALMTEYPNFSITGEEWSLNPLITSYWQKGKKNADGYTNCQKSPMDFPLQNALIQALKEPEGADFGKGMTRLYEALANDFVYPNPKNLLVFGDNHDMDRLYTQLNKDADLTQMALSYLLTIRGIPQIYYGTEVLIDNSAKPGDHGLIRTDFPGGWKDDPVNGFTGLGLSSDQLRVQTFLKTLLNWRKNKRVIHEGKTLHFGPQNGMYVYFRYDKEETVMVILNKNNSATPLELDRFAEILHPNSQALNVITGERLHLEKSLMVPAKSALILELPNP